MKRKTMRRRNSRKTFGGMPRAEPFDLIGKNKINEAGKEVEENKLQPELWTAAHQMYSDAATTIDKNYNLEPEWITSGHTIGVIYDTNENKYKIFEYTKPSNEVMLSGEDVKNKIRAPKAFGGLNLPKFEFPGKKYSHKNNIEAISDQLNEIVDGETMDGQFYAGIGVNECFKILKSPPQLSNEQYDYINAVYLFNWEEAVGLLNKVAVEVHEVYDDRHHIKHLKQILLEKKEYEPLKVIADEYKTQGKTPKQLEKLQLKNPDLNLFIQIPPAPMW